MVRIQTSQIIDRSPDDVFRFVATDHFENHPKWDPSVVEMEQTSTGPMRTGTTARLVRRDRGKRVEGTVEITEYEPNRRFVAVVRFGPFELRQDVTVVAVDESSSRLTLTIMTKATGVVKILLPFLRGKFAQTMTESLRRIKDMIERSGCSPRIR